eukprot:CAMPEP_0117433340 /NCGR_PEP_ID=MMETSP0758-20121206/12717_1 /TAXON_ID=63605 /ORGANISM="Percolomonas cosmopolitus, Strain AE-1 (ATCC 50343)" /LENGTH=309 /DNA_ID=CAMNT_0005223937 /DNA_START=542 /DNA_END=1467 /DNA_ORIENTATION=+
MMELMNIESISKIDPTIENVDHIKLKCPSIYNDICQIYKLRPVKGDLLDFDALFEAEEEIDQESDARTLDDVFQITQQHQQQQQQHQQQQQEAPPSQDLFFSAPSLDMISEQQDFQAATSSTKGLKENETKKKNENKMNDLFSLEDDIKKDKSSSKKNKKRVMKSRVIGKKRVISEESSSASVPIMYKPEQTISSSKRWSDSLNTTKTLRRRESAIKTESFKTPSRSQKQVSPPTTENKLNMMSPPPPPPPSTEENFDVPPPPRSPKRDTMDGIRQLSKESTPQKQKSPGIFDSLFSSLFGKKTQSLES